MIAPSSSILSPQPLWLRRTFEACASWFDRAPPSLQPRLAAVRARASRAQGASSIDGALTAPFATPFLALSEALRRDLDLPDGDGETTAGEAVTAAGEGTLALYFHLRVQDDLVDEPAAFDRAHVYTSELFASASAEAFARALGHHPGFWSLRRSVLDELAETATWEIDTFRALPLAEAAASAEEHAATLGSKLIPLAIPLCALAAIAGDASSFGWLRTCARSLARALQLANDLLNARDDHAARRLTPALAALYAGGRLSPDDPPHAVWPTLAGDPSLTRMLAAAEDHAATAASLADRTGARALAAEIRAATSPLPELPARLVKLSLGLPPGAPGARA